MTAIGRKQGVVAGEALGKVRAFSASPPVVAPSAVVAHRLGQVSFAPSASAPIQMGRRGEFGRKGKKGRGGDRSREVPKPAPDLGRAPMIEHQTRQERIARRKERRLRRDRKLAGKSAGPLEEVAVSRVTRPLHRDQVDALADSGTIDPSSVHTTQSTAGERFSDDSRVLDTVRELTAPRHHKRRVETVPSKKELRRRAKAEKQRELARAAAKEDRPEPEEPEEPDIEPIKITRKGGKAFTLDNRRLYAYRRAGVSIPYVLSEGRAASKDFDRKFSSTDEGRSMKVLARNEVPYEPEDVELDPLSEGEHFDSEDDDLDSAGEEEHFDSDDDEY
ncbi:MAG: hypothetical protein AAFX50_07670 [Acidobacteriota bacterium]